MRLTLRTLLAWLDDTLPPVEVRQIGQQVSESALAQELVEKIQRVTRQRRLTVPDDSGPEATDPSLVARYLDNVLSPEEVGEYEKTCLTSDVNLAEVASVHQILSLLAQRAKVPAEAKLRMYHLVRGREASHPSTPRVAAPPKPEPPLPLAWTAPEPEQRSAVERFGPLAAVAGLILLLCWSAWMSVGTADKPPPPLANAKIPPPPIPAKDRADGPAEKPEEPKDEAAKADPTPEEKAKADPAVAVPPATEVAKAADLPPGAAGVVGQVEGILLRYNPESRAWARLDAGAALRDGDRLANLPPALSPLRVGSAKLTMVGDGEIKVLAAGDGASSRFELVRGRVRVSGSDAKDPVAVALDSGVLKMGLPPAAVVGLERVNGRKPESPAPAAPRLRVAAVEGEVGLAAGAASETLAAGSSTFFQAPGTLAADPSEPEPRWPTEPDLSAADQERAKGLARYFKPDKSPLLCLVEAAEDENPQIRRDAVTSLGAIAPLDLIVTTMSKKDDPDSRKAAIAVLREAATRDAESAKNLRALLVAAGGSAEWADKVEKLLVGYSAKEADDEATGAKLVSLLKESEDVGVRELAIEALQGLSRRGDRLGYDPDKPQENGGIKAWQDLVQRRELRIPPAPKLR